MSKYTNFDLRNFLAEGKKGKEEKMDEAGPGFEHDCAAHVVHETYGYGVCIEGQHTLVENADGKHEVTHYDVFFKSGETVKNIPVNELEIKTLEEHSHGKNKKKNEEVGLEEEPVSAAAVAAGIAAIFGGSALIGKLMDKAERGDFGEKGKAVAKHLGDMGDAAAKVKRMEETEEVEEVQLDEQAATDLLDLVQNLDAGQLAMLASYVGGLGGVVAAKLKASDYCDANPDNKLCKAWKSFSKDAGQAIAAKKKAQGFEEGLTKEEAFKKEIKDILDS